MTNKLFSAFEAELANIIEVESDNISTIQTHLETLRDAHNNRKISSMYSSELKDNPSTEQVKADIFEEMSFSIGSSLSDSVIELLISTKHVEPIKDELLKHFESLKGTPKTNSLAALVALKAGGVEFIESHQLTDLNRIPYKTSFECPICETETDIKLTIHAITPDFYARKECSGCGHVSHEGCTCDFCLLNKSIFDRAKYVGGATSKVSRQH